MNSTCEHTGNKGHAPERPPSLLPQRFAFLAARHRLAIDAIAQRCTRATHKSRAAPDAADAMSARGKALTLVGVVTLAGTMFAVPMWIRNRMGGSLTAKEGELTGSQVQRGQFMNSGSRDVGRDPDWDGAVYRPKKPRKPS